MARFELPVGPDGKPKFFEIALDGAVCTTSWGNVGQPPTNATKKFASEDEAQKHFDKQVKDRVKRGFVEVGAAERAAEKSQALPAAELKTHLEAIAADTTRPDAFLVFADWLTSRDHPWGQLISLQHAAEHETGAKKKKELAALIAKLLSDDVAGVGALAKAGARFTWRRGFIDSGSVAGESGAELVKAAKELLKHPAAQAIGKLVLDARPAEMTTHRSWERDQLNDAIDPWADVLKALPSIVPAKITRLSFGASPPEPATAYTRMPDFAALGAALPEHVVELELAGLDPETPKPLALPHVTRLELRFALVTAGAIAAVAKSKLPNVTRLSLWLGGLAYCVLDNIYSPADPPYNEETEEVDEDFERYPPRYPARDLAHLEVYDVSSIAAANLAPLLGGKLPPKVKELGLQSTVLDQLVVEAIAAAPVLKDLERLDLSRGSFDEAGAKAMIARKKSFAHLALDLRRTTAPMKVLAKLREAFPDAVADDDDEKKAREPDFFMRYVATME